MEEPNRNNASRVKRSHKYSVKKKKRRATILVITGIVIALILIVGIWFFFHFRKFNSYSVISSLDISNTDERTTYADAEKGFIKCSGDGITFFDKKGIIWAETFEMTQPVMDTCGSYVAVADLKGVDVYLYDESGLVNRLAVAHPILSLEVSEQGVVAAATSDEKSNYIEVYDKEGNELITAKSIFSSSGYLMDIALSKDGGRLVASFLYVSEGTLESKVVFYDFNGGEQIVGGFNQYHDTAVTNVEFLDNNTVCAVGDKALSIYKFVKTPELIFENLDETFETQSLFFGNGRIGLITVDENGGDSYTFKVFNDRGKLIAEQGFDFPYSKAGFAGNNIILYSSNDCEMYSFSGVKKFEYAFDDRIEALLSCGNDREFVYASPNATEFIRIE